MKEVTEDRDGLLVEVLEHGGRPLPLRPRQQIGMGYCHAWEMEERRGRSHGVSRASSNPKMKLWAPEPYEDDFLAGVKGYILGRVGVIWDAIADEVMGQPDVAVDKPTNKPVEKLRGRLFYR